MGKPRGPYRKVPPTLRFWAYVQTGGPNDCWPWLGSTSLGYGRIGINRKQHLAHRFAYELLVGSLPPGAHLDHLCRNRACCNPRHLQPVSRFVNWLRGAHPSAVVHRTGVCKRGHLIEGENVQYIASRPNRRICAECRRMRDRAYYHRRKREDAEMP